MSIGPFSEIEDIREVRQCLLSLVHGGYIPGDFGDGNYYRCPHCFGLGPWPSEVQHRTHGGMPQGRECRVIRGRRLLVRTIQWLEVADHRSGDSPVIGE
jgi:hypothetical protein